MATLATQVVADTGLAPTTASAAGGGDKCAAGQGCFLYVLNGGGSSITVTLATPQIYQGDLALADRTVTVANGTFKLIAVPAFYANPADSGLCSITYSGVTTVTVAALRV